MPGAPGWFKYHIVMLSLCAAAALFGCAAASAAEHDPPLLEEMQRRCVLFFLEQADPDTGLVADRAPADGSGHPDVASIAATGFGLTALCIADARGWIEREDSYRRVLTTLRFLWEKMPHVRGYYYHFVDRRTGERVWDCELSSIDTALLMAGVLTARQYYKGTEVEALATKLYERVEWPWMLGGGETLRMAWWPERGFGDAAWDHYSEHMILQLLALGSPTHPLPPAPEAAWHAWRREPVVEYEGMTFLAYPPLFVHQFSHAWVDFRGVRDDYADYWQNSVLATRAHRLMCMKLSERFAHFGPKLWGITSSDYEHGYTAWGGPPQTANIDGTVAPCAAAGSMPMLPAECIETLTHMKKEYGDRIWKRYGFVDAFNPAAGWVARDVIGIDKGITLLMIENHRSGSVWKWFMANPEMKHAMKIAGFRPVEDASPDRTSSVYGLASIPAAVLEATWRGERGAAVRRIEEGWERADWQRMDLTNALEFGQPAGDEEAVAARFALLWDERALHVRVEVEDRRVRNDRSGAAIHEQDCVELFIDPQGDGLLWGDAADFQFGFAPGDQRWEWFGERLEFEARTMPTEEGYTVTAGIPWPTLGLEPAAGARMGLSVAVKDIQERTGAPVKLNWQWKAQGDRVMLGTVVLH